MINLTASSVAELGPGGTLLLLPNDGSPLSLLGEVG